MFSRRTLLRQLVGTACLAGYSRADQPGDSSPSSAQFSPEDDQFLEELEKANFQFFWEQADPHTGLVRDRCNSNTPDKNTSPASIASTGFGLTALCIGHKREIGRASCRERV